MNLEILEYVTSFLKYGVSDNILVDTNQKGFIKIKNILGGISKELKKYNSSVFIIQKKSKWKEYKEHIKSTNAKYIIFVIKTKFIPSGKEADSLFYFLSRIGEYTGLDDKELKEKSVSCVIVGENHSFTKDLSMATNSSLGLRMLELKKKQTELEEKN